MSSVAADHEVSILARVLASEQEKLPIDVARYLLRCQFSPHDRDRMHDLAVRNQDDVLSEDERDELIAYARTGTVLSILKSKARRVLKDKLQKSLTT